MCSGGISSAERGNQCFEKLLMGWPSQLEALRNFDNVLMVHWSLATILILDKHFCHIDRQCDRSLARSMFVELAVCTAVALREGLLFCIMLHHGARLRLPCKPFLTSATDFYDALNWNVLLIQQIECRSCCSWVAGWQRSRTTDREKIAEAE